MKRRRGRAFSFYLKLDGANAAPTLPRLPAASSPALHLMGMMPAGPPAYFRALPLHKVTADFDAGGAARYLARCRLPRKRRRYKRYAAEFVFICA